jgi:cell division protein FtsX
MKYTALVLKNLIRSKRRTFLTVLSIAVSLFIF